MGIILKDWYGEDHTYDHDTIWVRDTDGGLAQFTKGAKPTLGILEVNKNGVYDATGVSGYDRVIVEVEAEVNETLFNKTDFTGFAVDDSLGGLYSKSLGFGTDIEPLEIILGREYTVSWDGNLYTSVAKDTYRVFEEEDPIDGTTLYRYKYYLGNGSLLGYSDLEDTGESFVIVYQTYSNELVLISTENLDSHNVAIMKRVRPQDGLDMMLQSITVTENGTYTADPVYDGLKQVMVEVAGTSSADVRYVTFKSYDGLTEYGKKPVAVGDDCADPITRGIFGTPTRESAPQEDYTHNGWASEPNGAADPNWNKAITEDKTVYAAFKSSTRYYTISFYDGDELLNTEQVLHNGSSDYVPPVKDGYFFDTWEPKPVNVTSDISCYAQYKESIDFATATWAEISSVSEKGEATMHFAVGDEKTFAYTDQNGNSNTCTAVIVGFDHDDLSDGTGKAGISLMVKELLPNTTVKWWGNTYAIAYKASTLRTTLRDTVINYFPEDLRNVIKEVNKLADSKTSAGTPTIESVACKLWAPSQCEFYDFNQTNYESVIGEKYEGPVYPSTILKNKTGKSFYTRDIIRTGSPAPKYYKNTNGNVAISYSEAQTTLRNIVVGFCI